MTLDILRGLGTLLPLLAFTGVCLWAYSGDRKRDFDAAAQLPFADDDCGQRP
jgi:cytochrome c oxidase cbb3-type subunit 4